MKLSIKTLTLLSGIVFFAACNNNSPEKKDVKKDNIDTVVVINKDSLLETTGKKLLEILQSKQYDSLVNYFSDSVHFSPYGFIGSGKQTLSPADFLSLLSSNKKVNWGEYDGSGEPIDLTLQQYMEKFVYDADFLHAERSAIDSFLKTGNSLNNLKEIYRDCRFIEYHFSGFDKKYGGMDWISLRLVFKEQDGRYYLRAIVHDQWTI